MINSAELSQYIKQQRIDVSDGEIQKLIEEIDFHGNGEINYSEFLYATIDVKKFLTDQRLRAIFN
jgi:Ca2+-binding EF-hand superfamily protein